METTNQEILSVFEKEMRIKRACPNCHNELLVGMDKDYGYCRKCGAECKLEVV